MPIVKWTDGYRKERCEHYIVNSREKISEFLEHIEDELKSENLTLNVRSNLVLDLDKAVECTRDYKNTVDAAYNAHLKIINDVRNLSILTKSLFELPQNDRNILNRHFMMSYKMVHLMEEYSRNNITKYDLKEMMVTIKSMIEERILDSENSVKDTFFSVFLLKTKELVTIANMWYYEILHTFSAVNNHFVRSSKTGLEMENWARNMKIWRGPVFDIGHTDGIQLTRTIDETKLLWPPTLPLALYIQNGGAEEHIQESFYAYHETVNNEVVQICREISEHKNKIMNQLKNIDKHLTEFNESITLNHQFVL
jgi:hypothetical protein